MSDFSNVEMARALRVNRDLYQSFGLYPDFSKRISIPKRGGGVRRLTVPNAAAKVFASHVTTLLTPWLDRQFLPNSIGSRPQHSTWDLFAAIKHLGTATPLWILQSDLRRAFDTVAIAPLLENFREMGVPDSYRPLLNTLIRGTCDLAPRIRSDHNRTHGLDQGDPFSPLALNVRLHCCFDRPFQERAMNTWNWFRYVDNLYVLTPDQNAAGDACDWMQETLRETEFQLHDTQVHPIHNGGAEVMGLGVHAKQGEVKFSPLAGTLQKLQERLANCWKHQEPGKTAMNVIRSWIMSQGPCCECGSTSDGSLTAIEGVLTETGFLESVTENKLRQWISQSAKCWGKYMSPCGHTVR